MNKQQAAKLAIEGLGGVTQAANLLSIVFDEPISRHRVGKWVTRGVAHDWLWRVSALSGVHPDQLNPNVYPPGTVLPVLSRPAAKRALTYIPDAESLDTNVRRHIEQKAGMRVVSAEKSV